MGYKKMTQVEAGVIWCDNSPDRQKYNSAVRAHVSTRRHGHRHRHRHRHVNECRREVRCEQFALSPNSLIAGPNPTPWVKKRLFTKASTAPV